MASTSAKLLVIGYTAAASTFCGASGAYALTKTTIKDPAVFVGMMQSMIMAKSPSAREGYVAENLVGAKACIIPTTADTPEMLVSVEGFDVSKFEAAFTYAKGLHGYNGWGLTPLTTYRQEFVCAFESLPGEKRERVQGNMRASIKLSSIKLNSNIIKMADFIYHEHKHALWALLISVKYGTTAGDEMLREVGLDEANAFTRSFLALQIRKLTTTDMKEARDIQTHLASFQPEASKTFDQLVQLYGKDALLESLTKTGMLPQALNRIIFMQLMEELIDRDYGHHAHEHATPATDTRITMTDIHIGLMINYDMPLYGDTFSWNGFSTHIAPRLPIVEKLKKLPPGEHKAHTHAHAKHRPISEIASFATGLNGMISAAKKSWDQSAFIAADLTASLSANEALKADFIREDLRALVDAAIKRVQTASDMSQSLKEKLQLSLLQLSANLLAAPPHDKVDAAQAIGTDAVFQSQQFYSFFDKRTPCIQSATSIARDYAQNIKDNPLARDVRFHAYLDRLAENAKQNLRNIQGYSTELKADLVLLVDYVTTSIKTAQMPNIERGLHGLSVAQRKAQCG